MDWKVLVYANISNSEIEPFIAVKRDNFQHSQNHFIIVITDKWNHTVLAHITESSTDDDDDEGNDDDGNFGGSGEKNYSKQSNTMTFESNFT